MVIGYSQIREPNRLDASVLEICLRLPQQFPVRNVFSSLLHICCDQGYRRTVKAGEILLKDRVFLPTGVRIYTWGASLDIFFCCTSFLKKNISLIFDRYRDCAITALPICRLRINETAWSPASPSPGCSFTAPSPPTGPRAPTQITLLPT